MSRSVAITSWDLIVAKPRDPVSLVSESPVWTPLAVMDFSLTVSLLCA